MRMPIVENYRGVGIHDFQSEERISTVVKPAIDYVFTASDPNVLFAYAGNVDNPPEARLFAADRYRAIAEMRATAHVERPGRLVALDAAVAGADSLNWANPYHYGTLLDVPSPPRGARPEKRPAEQRARLIAAQRAGR
jgi:hypothetical protein